MFAYCLNDPVSRIDVSGTESVRVSEGNTEDDNPLNDGGFWGSGGGGGGSGNYSGGAVAHNNPSNIESPAINNPTNTDISPQNPLENITYSPKVVAQMSGNDMHGFPNVVDNNGGYGIQTQVIGGDGHIYTQLQIMGYYKGYDGVFEYMWDMNGVCNHRFFKKF